MNYAAQTSDPATFEIVKNSLYKIAEEMRVARSLPFLQRTCTKATSLFTTIPISAAATCPT
jgi:hypothetical protein